MQRRQVLAGAGVAAVAGFELSSPAIARSGRRLTMVTDWPEGPGLLPSARRLAETVNVTSGGRIAIEVAAVGEIVRPFETFDAVQTGTVDMFHSHIGYFEDRAPAFRFYSGVPFGLTTNELMAWARFGGGQELWDQACRPFNIKPLFCGTAGPQMGGWYLSEITSLEDLKGLRYRMAGAGAEVFRRLGAAVVLLSAADILPSLRSGAIDACEWVGPWLDEAMGLPEVASYYYYPGWHEPGGALTLGVNRAVWDSFDDADRRLIEVAATGEYAVALAEFNANNALALRRMREAGKVKFRRFSDDMLRAFALISADVVAEAGTGDALSRAAHRSYTDFRALIEEWTEMTEGAYLGARNRL